MLQQQEPDKYERFIEMEFTFYGKGEKDSEPITV